MTGVLGNVAGDCGDEIAASLIAKDLGVNFLRGSRRPADSAFAARRRRSASGEQRLHAACFEKPVFLPG